ncbi:MAG: hypothetical protein KME21_12655 [Desmonostoc vinosum HA7617-LM4]|nr:hypothetical protein [Desmonostoc vinosum HA7617-LM4]
MQESILVEADSCVRLFPDPAVDSNQIVVEFRHSNQQARSQLKQELITEL